MPYSCLVDNALLRALFVGGMEEEESATSQRNIRRVLFRVTVSVPVLVCLFVSIAFGVSTTMLDHNLWRAWLSVVIALIPFLLAYSLSRFCKVDFTDVGYSVVLAALAAVVTVFTLYSRGEYRHEGPLFAALIVSPMYGIRSFIQVLLFIFVVGCVTVGHLAMFIPKETVDFYAFFDDLSEEYKFANEDPRGLMFAMNTINTITVLSCVVYMASYYAHQQKTLTDNLGGVVRASELFSDAIADFDIETARTVIEDFEGALDTELLEVFCDIRDNLEHLRPYIQTVALPGRAARSAAVDVELDELGSPAPSIRHVPQHRANGTTHIDSNVVLSSEENGLSSGIDEVVKFTETTSEGTGSPNGGSPLHGGVAEKGFPQTNGNGNTAAGDMEVTSVTSSVAEIKTVTLSSTVVQPVAIGPTLKRRNTLRSMNPLVADSSRHGWPTQAAPPMSQGPSVVGLPAFAPRDPLGGNAHPRAELDRSGCTVVIVRCLHESVEYVKSNLSQSEADAIVDLLHERAEAQNGTLHHIGSNGDAIVTFGVVSSLRDPNGNALRFRNAVAKAIDRRPGWRSFTAMWCGTVKFAMAGTTVKHALLSARHLVELHALIDIAAMHGTHVSNDQIAAGVHGAYNVRQIDVVQLKYPVFGSSNTHISQMANHSSSSSFDSSSSMRSFSSVGNLVGGATGSGVMGAGGPGGAVVHATANLVGNVKVFEIGLRRLGTDSLEDGSTPQEWMYTLDKSEDTSTVFSTVFSKAAAGLFDEALDRLSTLPLSVSETDPSFKLLESQLARCKTIGRKSYFRRWGPEGTL